MSIRPNQINTDTKQTANNILPYYPNPQYGYRSSSTYYPGYTDPYMYPSPPYNNNSEYANYPINEYGQMTGGPTYFPPIVNQHQSGYYIYPSYGPNGSSGATYMYPSRNDPIYYQDYYYHHPNSYPGYETARHEYLPPLHQHRPISNQSVALPIEDDYEQFNVIDLTGRNLLPSRSTERDTKRRNRHHNKLKKRYG
ncbi:unnamed protein product [Rotaria sordida]|uniref:Uncharacterized protein n=1 Tax=Rotaria sordida TaxID=392033 RepID=A0A819U772_9BILA|nr:unnamed protein product [Rotaria sordida]CAF4098612.1 unnamed protein product [Rotaria sordida]